MLIGAFVGFVGTYFSGSILVGLLLAVIGPMVMATLMAFLSVSLRTNQLVAGLAIWLLGAGLAALLYRLTFGVVTITPHIEALPVISIPILSDIPIIGPILFNHDALIYFGLLLIPLTHIFLFKTNLGLKIRTVGENPKQADTLGVSVNKIRYLAVIIGGAIGWVRRIVHSLGHNRFFLRKYCSRTRVDRAGCSNIRQMETILDSNRSASLRNGKCFSTGSPDNGLSHTISIPANAAISFTYCYFSCNV